MIEFKNVTFSYNNKSNQLVDVSFKLNDSDSAILFGPNEDDFLAFFDVLCNFENGYTGTILLDGEDRKRVSGKDAKISYITKKPIVFNYKSVYKNLEYALKVNGEDVKSSEVKQKIYDALAKFNVYELIKKPFRKLMPRQKFIVLYVRAYLRGARVVLINEPETYGMRSNDLNSIFEKTDIAFILATKNLKLFNELNAKKYLLSYGIMNEYDHKNVVIDNLFYRELKDDYILLQLDAKIEENTCIMSDKAYEISCDLKDGDKIKSILELCENKVKILIRDDIYRMLKENKKLKFDSDAFSKGEVIVFEARFGFKIDF